MLSVAASFQWLWLLGSLASQGFCAGPATGAGAARDGDTAVVTGVAEVTLDETAGPRTVWSRYTHVWILRDGRWRLLYREARESPGPLPDTEATTDLAP